MQSASKTFHASLNVKQIMGIVGIVENHWRGDLNAIRMQLEC
jgi:hypothetical protein